MEEIKQDLYRVTIDEVKNRGKFTLREKFRFHCPVCGDEEKHSRRFDAQFNQTMGVGHCFCCGASFVLAKDWQPQYVPPARIVNKEKKTDAKTPEEIGKRVNLGEYPSDITDYLKKRGLRADVMHLLGVGWAKLRYKYSTEPDVEKYSLAFRYLEDGVLHNVQYKSVDKDFQLEAGCKLIPYNIDDALDADTVYLTEGMLDAATLVQCGYQGVISLPNGTGSDMKTFDPYLKTHFEGKRIIYAGDTDEPGVKKRIEVAQYFDGNEFCYVEWSLSASDESKGDEHPKDANDVLMMEGEDAVRRCVQSAKSMPIVGVATIDDQMEAVLELAENGVPRFPGIKLFGFTHMVHFEPGRVMVISGYPGSGKSTFADNIVIRLAVEQKWRAAIFSPEKYPMSLHYFELGQILMGNAMSSKDLSRQAVQRGINFLRENIFHISEEKSEIGDILAVATKLVRQKDIRVLLIDPFNYVDLPVMAGANDTQKISAVLKQIVEFAHTNKVLVIVVAHPKKPQSEGGRGGQLFYPSLYDIAGSADFYNKCDYGLILQRDKQTEYTKAPLLTWVHVEKVRFRHLGQIGRRAFGFDPVSSRFVGTEDDRTIKPYDRTDWSHIEAEQQDIVWPEDADGDTFAPTDENDANDDDLKPTDEIAPF